LVNAGFDVLSSACGRMGRDMRKLPACKISTNARDRRSTLLAGIIRARCLECEIPDSIPQRMIGVADALKLQLLRFGGGLA